MEFLDDPLFRGKYLASQFFTILFFSFRYTLGNYDCILRGWLRCSVLIHTEEDVEILNDLAKEVLRLDDLCLLAEEDQDDPGCENSVEESGSRNRFFPFLRMLGSAQRDLGLRNDLDGQDQLRTRFQLDYMVDVLKSEVKMPGPADRHVYRVFSTLVRECSPLLVRRRNLISEISDVLIDFR